VEGLPQVVEDLINLPPSMEGGGRPSTTSLRLGEQVDAIAAADARRDSRGVWEGVRRLAGKHRRFSQTQPTADADGRGFADLDALAEAWRTFLAGKFVRTEEDARKGDMPPIRPPD
jgi:hypothetical protein